jgi:hypothetical protein
MGKAAKESDRSAVEYVEGRHALGKQVKRSSITDKYGAAIEAMYGERASA